MSFLVVVFIVVSASLCTPLAAQVNFSAAIQELKPAQENKSLEENFSHHFNPASDFYDRFDWTLIKLVATSLEGNFLLSPLGLKLNLLLLKETATGYTAAELSAIFRDDLNKTENRNKHEDITRLLKKSYPKNIAYLNSWIFIPAYFKIRSLFQAIGNEFYNTDLTTVNTQSLTETVEEINAKVLNTTLGNLSNAVNKDEVTDMSMLVLTTLYIKGSWRHRFELSATRFGDFHTTPTTLKVAKFMNVINMFYYGESTKFDAKILRISYWISRFAMYIIVPNSLSGLPYIVENLSVLPLELHILREHYVDVTLPKFDFAYTAHLEDTLKKMDLRSAFDDRASFPGIARRQPNYRIKLSKVMQRFVISINEHGSGEIPTQEMSPSNQFDEDFNVDKEVLVNRPFFFIIRDEATSQLLASGRVVDPTLTEDARV